MTDLFSAYYMSPETVNFLQTLVSWVRTILVGRDFSASELRGAYSILDILEGWMPLSLGRGYLRLEVYRFGRLLIRIRDEQVEVDYKPWHSRHPSQHYRPLLHTSIDGRFQMVHEEYRGDMIRLLKQASALPGPDFDERGLLLVKWRLNPVKIPTPAPEWEILRQTASLKGTPPPRASHWLPQALQERKDVPRL